METGAVVHVQRATVQSSIATHYCSFDMVVHVQTNMINLWILPYKCFTEVPYKSGMVKHATKDETTKITVAPY